MRWEKPAVDGCHIIQARRAAPGTLAAVYRGCHAPVFFGYFESYSVAQAGICAATVEAHGDLQPPAGKRRTCGGPVDVRASPHTLLAPGNGQIMITSLTLAVHL